MYPISLNFFFRQLQNVKVLYAHVEKLTGYRSFRSFDFIDVLNIVTYVIEIENKIMIIFQTVTIILKGINAVWMCYDQKLPEVDVIPHYSICL